MATTSEKSAFSVLGCAHKFGLALERAGGEPADLNRAAENKALMEGFLALVRGCAKITIVKHVVDLDALSFIPSGWKIESHKKGGSFEWDPAKIALHLEPEQADGKSLKGTELQKRLEGKPVFNSTMLDWLLAHTELIPEGWKQDDNGNTRYIFFFGTIYRRSDGYLCVRCLCWHGGRWDWGGYWVGYEFGDQDPAAVLASI